MRHQDLGCAFWRLRARPNEPDGHPVTGIARPPDGSAGPQLDVTSMWGAALRHAVRQTGGGVISGAGVGPASALPLPVRRLMARTVMS